MVTLEILQKNVFVITNKDKFESSDAILKRVITAKDIQQKRFKDSSYKQNSQIPSQDILKFLNLDSATKSTLKKANDKFNFSARSYFKILKVARTIADLNKRDNVIQQDILESLTFRFNS